MEMMAYKNKENHNHPFFRPIRRKLNQLSPRLTQIERADKIIDQVGLQEVREIILESELAQYRSDGDNSIMQRGHKVQEAMSEQNTAIQQITEYTA